MASRLVNLFPPIFAVSSRRPPTPRTHLRTVFGATPNRLATVARESGVSCVKSVTRDRVAHPEARNDTPKFSIRSEANRLTQEAQAFLGRHCIAESVPAASHG